jgi:hypothetical protein
MPLKNLNKKPYKKITKRKQKEMKRNLKRENPKTRRKICFFKKKTASCESQKTSPKMKIYE